MIVAAALRLANGRLVTQPPPARHHTLLMQLYAESDVKLPLYVPPKHEQGFVTDDGRFLDRKAAGEHALAHGQILSLGHPPNLYSEDLW
jgi:hypothetical protein